MALNQHPADLSDIEKIAQATYFTIHLRSGPHDKVTKRAKTLAAAVTAADKLGKTGSGKVPMIYAVTPDKMTVHVPAAMIAQARREIEAADKRRLADEYDAAQDRGEIAKRGGERSGREHSLAAPSASEVGLDRKDIHDARRVRDVIAANPKAVREALDDILANGDEPTRAALKRATAPRKAASKDKGARPIGRRAEIAENAAKGILPPVPDFSAETHKRFRGKLAEIVKLVEAGDLAALKAIAIKPYSSSPKAMARYRDLAVMAIEAGSDNRPI